MAIANDIESIIERLGGRGTIEENTGSLPVPGDGMESGRKSIAGPAHKRHIPHVGEHHAMTAVIRGEAAISPLVENVLRKRTESAGDKHLGRIVDELGVRVRPTKQQAMRELAIERQLSGVIDRVPAMGSHKNWAEIRIHTDKVAVRIKLTGSGVVVLIDEKTLAPSSNIRGSENEITGELSLNV